MCKTYNKLLIGHYHPENNCNVEEGTVLTVSPKIEVEMKGQVAHHFVDSKNRKTKSKYGWVKTVDSFNLQDFLDTYQSDVRSEGEVEHVKIMLDSVNRLGDDLPVAATYSQRGVEEKKMVFTVHRVFFY